MNKLIVIICVLSFFVSGSAQASDYFVNAESGNDSWDGRADQWDGLHGPKATVQAAIDAADNSDRVTLAQGQYTGDGNRDLDFEGKALTLRSSDPCDPDIVVATVLMSGGSSAQPHRGLYFHSQEGANSIVEGLTITGGFAWGGGIYCSNSSPTIRYCVITSNTAETSGGAIHCDNSSPTISNCTITSNTANSTGGGIHCNNSSPVLIDCVISGNSAHNGGGIYCSSQSYPELIRCTVDNNSAQGDDPKLSYKGGGICAESDCDLTIDRCGFNGNFAFSFGGGIYALNSFLEITNCQITGNYTGIYGGGMYCNSGTATITSSTLTANSAQSRGGAVRLYDYSSVTITNCILWADTIALEDIGGEIALAKGSSLAVSYSNIHNGDDMIAMEADCSLNWIVDDEGDQTNMDQDPLFIENGYWHTNGTEEDTSDDYWVNGDYSLLRLSACIDRGNNQASADFDTDLAGNDRIFNNTIDMGAYECPYSTRPISTSMFMAQPGRERMAQQDSFMARGNFDILEQEFAQAESISICLWHQSELVFSSGNIAIDQSKFRMGRYIAIGSPGIYLMLLDMNGGTFMLMGRQIDLPGLQAPVTMTIEVGEYFGVCHITADMMIIPLSMKFVLGRDDVLRVDRTILRCSTTAGMLLLMGGIAVEQLDTDMSGEELNLYWGSFNAHIPAAGITGSGSRYRYSKPFGAPPLDDPSAAYVNMAMFDLSNCTFLIMVTGANIPEQSSPLDCRLTFGDFNETVSVEY